MAFAVRHFKLGEVRVLDIACGAAQDLACFGPGSAGLELQQSAIHRAHAQGLDVRQADTTDGLPGNVTGQFDAVRCSNILEHVLRPHEFLLAARRALRPGGLFVAVVPLTRPLAVGSWRGFLAADHVDFFTARTLRLTFERAGIRPVFMGSSSVPWAPKWLARLLALVSPNVLVAGIPFDEFHYPEKALKRLDPRGRVSFKA